MISDITSQKLIFTSALRRRMLIGTGIGLVVISFFVISAGKGNPSWEPYWRIKPLLLTPITGALVGGCFDVTQRLRDIRGWLGKLFLILSYLGYFVGIWMGIILGLAGTLWN